MIGLYLHVPYCTVRCSYCDFYLVARRQPALSAYCEALRGEIVLRGREFAAGHADTVHFGGGTPSLLTPEDVGAILSSIRASFALDPEAEIALEANPEDLDAERIEAYVATGVNRLSIGVQSLDDDLLKLMRRPHDARDAVAAVDAARRSRIRSVGVDLILGLPGQDPRRVREEIGELMDRGVEHLSLYLLEVHDRTLLGRRAALGLVRLPADDEAARLYEEAADLIERRGFEHYEISNFARPGFRSRHNLKYWTNQEYLGLGPSAHSYMGESRWENGRDLRAYLASGGIGVARIPDDPSRAKRAFEALVSGLRLAEGVDLGGLRARYGPAFVPPNDDCLESLARAGLLVRETHRLRLTRRGRLVSNEVFERLLPPVPSSV